MDKTNPKIDKILDQIAANQTHGAQKAIKKLREKPDKSITPADEAVLGTLSAYVKLQSFRFGSAMAEIDAFKKLMEVANPDLLIERFNFYHHLFEGLGQTRLLSNMLARQLPLAEPPKQQVFRKHLVGLLALDGNFAECSVQLSKWASYDKDSYIYQYASIVCKLLHIFMTAKRQLDSPHAIEKYRPYMFFDLTLPANDVKILQISVKLLSQLKDKNPSLNTPSTAMFINYMALCAHLGSDDFGMIGTVLRSISPDHEWFVIVRRLMDRLSNKPEALALLSKLYEDTLLDHLCVSKIDELSDRMPDFETVHAYINALDCSMVDFKEQASSFTSAKPLPKIELLAIDDKASRLLAILVNNCKILGDLTDHSLHRKNWLLLIQLTLQRASAPNETCEFFFWAADQYVHRYADNFVFANEATQLFEKNSALMKRLQEGLASKDGSMTPLAELNFYKMEGKLSSAGEEEFLTRLRYSLAQYKKYFDHKKVLEKGERRFEDEWLVLALEICQQLYESSGKAEYIRLINHLAFFGFSKSRFNFDILLSLVRANRILGLYMYNSDLFYENDLKGNQYETLGYLFLGSLYEFRVADKHSHERLERIFKNYTEVCATGQKNFLSAIKTSNFLFHEEFLANWDMNRGSYFKAILFHYLANGFLVKAMKNLNDSEESADNYNYFADVLGDLSAFRYVNLDFLAGELFGPYFNVNLLKANLLFNRFCFNIGYAGKKVVEEEKALAELLSFIQGITELSKTNFFIIIRRNLLEREIRRAFELEGKRYSRFINQPSVTSAFKLFEVFLRLILTVARGETCKDAANHFKTAVTELPEKTTLSNFSVYFSTAMVLDLLYKASFILEKISRGSKELQALNLSEVVKSKVGKLIEGLTPASVSAEEVQVLIDADTDLLDFLQLNEVSKALYQKAIDSASNFKFSMDQMYKFK